MLAAILISSAAAAETANGPDSNYQTGVMSVILIGLTAVPAFLTAFWGAHGCWASCGKKEKNSAGMAPEISVGGPTQGGQQVHQVVLLP